MKLLFVNPDDPWAVRTGYTLLSRKTIDLLAARHDVHVLCLNAPRATFDEADGFSVTALRQREHASRKRAAQVRAMLLGRPMLLSQFDGCDYAAHVVDHTRAGGYDAVIFNHLRAAWLAEPISRALPDVPTLYFAHNAESAAMASVARLVGSPITRLPLRIDADRTARLEGDVLSHVRHTVALTHEDAARLASLQRGATFTIAPPGTNLPNADAVAQPGRNDPALLCVGSFLWLPKRRNAEWLIREVMPRVTAAGHNVRLRIVGQGASRLAPAASNMPVDLHSDVPDVAPYLTDAAVFVIAERQEGGIKLKAIEAAAYGLPIVSTPEGVEGTGLRERDACLIADGADSFATQIGTLLADANRRTALGRAARQCIEARADWAIFLAAVENAIDKARSAARA